MQWINLTVVFIHFLLASFWCTSFYVVEAPIKVPVKKKAPEPVKREQFVDPTLKEYERPLPPVPQPTPPETRNEFIWRQLSYCQIAMMPISFNTCSFLALVSGSPFWLFFWGFHYPLLPQGRIIGLALIHAGQQLAACIFGAVLIGSVVTSFLYLAFYDDLKDFSLQYWLQTSDGTLYQYVLSSIHFGIQKGDIIGSVGPGFSFKSKATGLPVRSFPKDFWEQFEYSHETASIILWLCTMFYRLYWVFIVLAVTKSVIVSTFNGLQARDKELITDAQEKCLICTMKRFDLDQHGGGFINHLENHHNPLHFLGFLVKLALGVEEEFTGIESDVHSRFHANDHTFFPIEKCTNVQKLQRQNAAIKLKAEQDSKQEAAASNKQEEEFLSQLTAIDTQLMQPIERISKTTRRFGLLEDRMKSFSVLMESLINKKQLASG